MPWNLFAATVAAMLLICASRTGLIDMTTTVALEHIIFRELLGLYQVGVAMYLSPFDHCHVRSRSLTVLAAYVYHVRQRMHYSIACDTKKSCTYFLQLRPYIALQDFASAFAMKLHS